MTFTQYGVTAFDVQYWDGAAWVTVAGGSVSGNNKVWRRFSFPAVATAKVRVLVGAALFHNSRVVEAEAYQAGPRPLVTGKTVGALRNDYTGQVGMKVTLAAQAAYYVVSAEAAGGDQWHDYAATSLTTTSAAAVDSGIFSGDGTSWIPAGGAGHSYVPVDFKYTSHETNTENKTSRSGLLCLL